MASFLSGLLIVSGFTLATQARAGDVIRSIIAEADPVAPASSAYEQSQSGVVTDKWGAAVDFNMGAKFSTGPELWMGTFVVKGPDGSGSPTARREDFWPGERQKLDATRFRWNVGYWEQGQSMRGWYFKAAYSYTKINSRANRYTESVDGANGLSYIPSDSPGDETDLLTDIRHGISGSFGTRWFVYERMTASVGASLTKNFKRAVDVDSSDGNAKADYEDLIEHKLPDTRISLRPTPEVNVALGYAF
ncbi:MAG: hypothetical protein NTV34_08200 [Proteobacteria bacterium]|nr:hypothetical protein [Pseudomonadota bacterium]